MDLDKPRLGSIERKRALTPSDSEQEEDSHSPSDEKRSRQDVTFRTQGIISAREALAFDAAGLLQHLAFTQLYVTANFSNFNSSQSLVLLYLGSEVSWHYQSLW